VWFALVCAACLAGVAAYVVTRPSGAPSVSTPASTSAPVPSLAGLRSRPHVYYLSMRQAEFNRVVVGALEDPNASRVATDLACERVDFNATRGVCLVDNRLNLHPPALARIVDLDFKTLHEVPLPGFPSRTRISPDGRYAAATVFVEGENYDGIDFSTRTIVFELETGRAVGDLEQFTTIKDGKPIKAADFNFWGMTFERDSNRFYATLGTGRIRYLVRGDLAKRQVEVLRAGVECPSLSPDGRHIAFKSRIADGREWRLHVLDVASLRDWPIAAETRHIDDQVAWLDNEHVLYRYLDNRGLPEVAANVFAAPIAEGAAGAPRLVVRAASSPAVVRPDAVPGVGR
jgi:hypothetical protein